MNRTARIILAPQHHVRTIGAQLDRLPEGPIAAITAGWQEREEEDDELRAEASGRTFNLRLYARYDEVLREDRLLAVAHRARQDRLRAHQLMYRARLAHALAAARDTLANPGDPELVTSHAKAALEAVRLLDRQHAASLAGVHRDFDVRMQPLQRPVLARHRAEILEQLATASGVAIAGGHVGVLLTRLRLFSLEKALSELPVIAWSAGAMAVSRRVVLFHDSPPQGAGNAEVFDAGIGLMRGVVPLPHGERRLALDDPLRMSLLALRFAPTACVVPADGCVLWRTSSGWRGNHAALRVHGNGEVLPMADAPGDDTLANEDS